jgi:hypothetical protein
MSWLDVCFFPAMRLISRLFSFVCRSCTHRDCYHKDGGTSLARSFLVLTAPPHPQHLIPRLLLQAAVIVFIVFVICVIVARVFPALHHFCISAFFVAVFLIMYALPSPNEKKTRNPLSFILQVPLLCERERGGHFPPAQGFCHLHWSRCPRTLQVFPSVVSFPMPPTINASALGPFAPWTAERRPATTSSSPRKRWRNPFSCRTPPSEYRSP